MARDVYDRSRDSQLDVTRLSPPVTRTSVHAAESPVRALGFDNSPVQLALSISRTNRKVVGSEPSFTLRTSVSLQSPWRKLRMPCLDGDLLLGVRVKGAHGRNPAIALLLKDMAGAGHAEHPR